MDTLVVFIALQFKCGFPLPFPHVFIALLFKKVVGEDQIILP